MSVKGDKKKWDFHVTCQLHEDDDVLKIHFSLTLTDFERNAFYSNINLVHLLKCEFIQHYSNSIFPKMMAFEHVEQGYNESGIVPNRFYIYDMEAEKEAATVM